MSNDTTTTTTEVDAEALQTYMDTFAEDGNEFLTLTAKSSDNNSMFVDQDGYYYNIDNSLVAADTKNITEKPSTSKKAAAAATTTSGRSTRKSTSKKTIVAAVKKIEEPTTIDDEYSTFIATDEDDIDPDDPSNEQIYEFNEDLIEGEGEDDGATNGAADQDYVPKKVIRIKPNAANAAGGSSNAAGNAISFTCAHCTYTTNKKYLLSRHMRAHTDDRPYTCSVCERGFRTNASLLNHVNTHLGNKPHACKSCTMAFTTSGELVRHVRYRHTKEKPHKCTECDYSSVELSKLRRHIRCHTGERPYQCPHCTYASPDTFKLKRHMRTHTGEKPYECEICHSRFTQSNSLKAHRLIHSIGDKPIFQCELCPTTCGRKNDLRMHIQKLHRSEHPITCKRCGKDLPDRYSYKVHLKTHEGEKCFRCQVCPYASISQRHLESHMLIHTDEKPYVCESCNLAFRQRQLLKRHINLYHKEDYVRPEPREKIHTCPHCKRPFTHKGNLMRHMETHDPNSNAESNKWELKIGRMTRVQDDGSITILNSANEKLEETEDKEMAKDHNVAAAAASADSDDLDEDELIGYEDDDLDYEIIETIEEDDADEKVVEEEELLVEQKPLDSKSFLKNIILKVPPTSANNANAEYVPDIKNVSIKKEPNGKEFMSVQVGDSQQYMLVEVISCDEGEEDDDDNCITVEEEEIAAEHMQMTNTSLNTTNINDCFGFEEDVVEEDEFFNRSAEPKAGIQLMHIIEEQ